MPALSARLVASQVTTYARCASPIVAVAALLALYYLVYNGFVLCDVGFVACEPSFVVQYGVQGGMAGAVEDVHQRIVGAYAGQMRWALAAGLSVLVGLGAAGYACYLLVWSLDTVRPLVRVGSVVGALVGVGVVSIALVGTNEGHSAHTWRQLTAPTVAEAFPPVVPWTPWLDTTAMLVAFLVAVAISALLARSLTTDVSERSSLEPFRSRLEWALYAGAALLVVNAFRVTALMSWSLSFLNPESAYSGGVESVASAVVFSQGCLYSLLLAGVYVPAALILERRARSTATDAKDAEGPNRPDSFGVLTMLTQLAAILSPLLTGPIADLVGLLSL